MQYRLRQHDGEYRWIDDTGIPRYAHDGTFLGYIGSCVDVHDHRKPQTELRRRSLEIAELNRQADAAMLAASIAHEINQPITAIVSNSTAALRWLNGETPNVERAKATLNNIIRAGQRAGEISLSQARNPTTFRMLRKSFTPKMAGPEWAIGSVTIGSLISDKRQRSSERNGGCCTLKQGVFLRRNAVARRGEQIHRIEPCVDSSAFGGCVS